MTVSRSGSMLNRNRKTANHVTKNLYIFIKLNFGVWWESRTIYVQSCYNFTTETSGLGSIKISEAYFKTINCFFDAESTSRFRTASPFSRRIFLETSPNGLKILHD